MRLLIMLILTFIHLTISGQEYHEKYQDYFGHSIELNKDSTFRCEWHFDLMYEWAIGKWTKSDQTIVLKFIDVYDTLIRVGKQDSLVLSIDEKSNRIGEVEFISNAFISGGQYKQRFKDTFRKKGDRLYIVKENGRLNRSRQREIWPQRRFPFGYKKWPAYYKKIE